MFNEITPVYTKYHLTGQYSPLDVYTGITLGDNAYNIDVSFYAKISDSKITLRNQNNRKDFAFVKTDKNKMKLMCELILGAIQQHKNSLEVPKLNINKGASAINRSFDANTRTTYVPPDKDSVTRT
jgi:hypothetical protein